MRISSQIDLGMSIQVPLQVTDEPICFRDGWVKCSSFFLLWDGILIRQLLIQRSFGYGFARQYRARGSASAIFIR